MNILRKPGRHPHPEASGWGCNLTLTKLNHQETKFTK